MQQKFVLRLLTESGDLLGWCEHHIKPTPNRELGHSAFRVSSSEFRVVAGGTAHFISIHWCDLDVARKVELAGGPMAIPQSSVGATARMDWMQAIWGVQGNTNVPLPPVTVGSIMLTPPPAQMGAVAG